MADISNLEKLIPKATFVNMVTRAYSFYRAHNSVWPARVYIYPGLRGDYISRARFLDMKARYDAAVRANLSFSSVWIKRPADAPQPKPIVVDDCYSSTKWSIVQQHYAQNATCGPSAFVEAIAEFNVFDITHEEAAIAMGTNVGTDPDKLLSGGKALLAKKGINTKTYKKTFSELGGWKGVGQLIVDPKRTFVVHHCYKCNKTLGHYVALMKVCLTKKLVTVAENLHGQYEERPFSSMECDINCMTWGDGKSFLIFERT